MKKIITAIGNNILNENLRKNEDIEVIGKDIQYKEGVIEFLKENNNIDILILSQILEGEIDFKALIESVLRINNKIEMIVFLEEDDLEIRNFLYSKGIFKIYKNNQIDIKELNSIIEEKASKETEALNEEIRKLKQIIENQKKDINQKGILKNNKEGRIVAITGAYGTREKYNYKRYF